MKSILLILSLLCLLQASRTCAQPDSSRGLQSDIFLHPGDAFTAYTLRKNEFVYNQSPLTLPLPSWAWWGITDRITAEIDLLPLVGGLFQEPHLPVPSFNFRFALYDQKGIRPAVAFETMFQHLWRTQNQLDAPSMRIERDPGSSWYNRFNCSWYNGKRTRIHFSAGVTYTGRLLIGTKDSLNYRGRYFRNAWNPDLSIGYDWRPRPWLAVHVAFSYGTTFVYLDNIPRKYQLGYGVRLAPFYRSRWGFFRTFRMELTSLSMYFPDARKAYSTYLPVFPYVYWQWQLKRRNTDG